MPSIYNGSGGGVMAAILARPLDTHTARNRARQEALMLTQAIAGQEEKRLASLNAQDAQLQSDMSALANLDVLQQGKSRIHNEVAKPLKEDIKKRIRDEYGGDYEAFLASEGSYHRQRAKEAIQSNPIIQQEIQNKIHYGLIRKDQIDGKITRPEDQKSFADYLTGSSSSISYSGGLDAPKDIYKHFETTENPANPQGIIDYKTGKQTAIPVTRQDVLNQLKSQYSEKDAQYILDNHLKYQDGDKSWKLHALPPDWLQKAQLNQARYQLSQRTASDASARGWAGLALRERAEKRMAAKEKAKGTADKNTSEVLETTIYGSDGIPLQKGSRILRQPVLTKESQQTVMDLMGGRKKNVKTYNPTTQLDETTAKIVVTPRTNVEMYDVTERTKEGTAAGRGRTSYVTSHRGMGNPFIKQFVDSDGTMTFDNVDLNNVVKIPVDGGGYKPAVLVTKQKKGEDGKVISTHSAYMVLPSDELTKRQVRASKAANANKKEPATIPQYEPTGGTSVPLFDTDDDEN